MLVRKYIKFSLANLFLLCFFIYYFYILIEISVTPFPLFISLIFLLSLVVGPPWVQSSYCSFFSSFLFYLLEDFLELIFKALYHSPVTLILIFKFSYDVFILDILVVLSFRVINVITEAINCIDFFSSASCIILFNFTFKCHSYSCKHSQTGGNHWLSICN